MAKLYNHPEYDKHYPHWTELDDLYRGDHDTLVTADYLWPHMIEANYADPLARKLRKAREQRTRYLNIPEIVLSLLISFLFRKRPEYSPALLKLLGVGEKNIDGRGNSLLQFVKNKLTKDYLLFGKVAVLVDRTPQGARNRQEENESGARAYMDTICPLALPDWSLSAEQAEATQRFDFFRYEYELTAARNNEREQPKTDLYSDSYVDSGGVVTVNRYRRRQDKEGRYAVAEDGENWELIAELPLELDHIPAAQMTDESWIKDVAQETLRHYNIRSNRDNINYNQGYQRLWGAGLDPNDPNVVKGLSEYTMMLVPEGASINALPPADPQHLERAENEALINAFRVGLNQLKLLPSDSRAAEGADTLAEQKDNTVALMEGVIEDIENLTNAAIKEYAIFTGNDSFEPDLKLPRDFTSESIEQFVMLYQAFGDKFRAVPEADKIMLKRAVSKMNLDEQDVKDIIKAIDSAKATAAPEQERTDKLSAVLNGDRAP